MILDGNQINIGVAFLAGMASFFAPCVVPLLPAYVGYFTGVGASGDAVKKHRWQILKGSLFFVMGFILIFVLLGLSATSIGQLFAQHKLIISRIGGGVLILLGLFLLGAFKNPALYRERKFDLHGKLTKYQSVNAFVLGLTFGFAWTPCIGPVLAVILFWASQAQTMVQGLVMMLAFGLGIAVPFLVISLFIDRLMSWLRKTQRLQEIVHKVAGWIIVVFGILLLTNWIAPAFGWLTHYGSLELFLIDHL